MFEYVHSRFTLALRAAVILALVGLLTACDSTEDDELIIEDLVVGLGEPTQNGMILTLHYRGWLEDGTQFDSSYDRNEPLEVVLGAPGLIEGFSRGLVGMRVGGKRKLTIPPGLGYGKEPYHDIPGNSTLIFEIELLSLRAPDQA